jgi:hypothetical protein
MAKPSGSGSRITTQAISVTLFGGDGADHRALPQELRRWELVKAFPELAEQLEASHGTQPGQALPAGT